MLKSFRTLWVGIPVVAVLFGWRLLFEHVRKAVVGTSQTPEALRNWWLLAGAGYFVLFALTAAFVLVFFHILRRSVTGFLKIACIANAFVVWLLLGLAAIVSDPAVVTDLSRLGLAYLPGGLWLLGMIWWAPTLYILFQSVDASPIMPNAPNTERG